MCNNHRLVVVVACLVTLLGVCPVASALDIQIIVDRAGSYRPSYDPNLNELERVLNAAAQHWEDLIPDTHTMTFTVRYGNYDGLASTAWTARSGDRVTAADCTFAGLQPDWYFDPNTDNHSEYDMINYLYRDLPAGDKSNWFSGSVPDELEVGYVGLAPAGSPARDKYDVYAVALHEIGHNLGLPAPLNGDVAPQLLDNEYDFNSSLVNGNTMAATTYENAAHLKDLKALMQPWTGPGERKLPSATDLFAMESLAGWTQIDLKRKYFIGASSWTNTSNWAGNRLPDSGDTVYLLDGGPVYMYASDYIANLIVSDGSDLYTGDEYLRVYNTTSITYTAGLFGTGIDVGNGSTFITDDLEVNGGYFDAGTGSTVTVYENLTLGSNDGDTGLLRGNSTITIHGQLINNGIIKPGSGEVLVLADPSPTSSCFDLDGGTGNGEVDASIGRIMFQGKLTDAFDGTMSIGDGQEINFNNPVTLNPGSTLNFDGTSDTATLAGTTFLINSSDINVIGAARINGGVTFGPNASATISSGGLLELNNDTTYNGGVFSGAGELQQDGDATFAGNTTISVDMFDWDGVTISSTTINPGITLTINSDQIDGGTDGYDGIVTVNSGVLSVNTSGPWRLDSGATLNLHKTTTARPEVRGSATMEVHGTIDVMTEGEIDCNSVIHSEAQINVPPGATLYWEDPVLFAGGTHTSPGNWVINDDVTITASTTLNVTSLDLDGHGSELGDLTVSSGVALIINANQIESMPADGFDGTLTLNSGTAAVNVPGEFRIDNKLVLNDTGGGKPTLNGSPIEMCGDIEVTGTGRINPDVQFTSSASVQVAAASDKLELIGDVEYRGGSYTGAGTLFHGGDVNVTASTTIDVGTFDWDGGGGTPQTTIGSGDTLTINASQIETSPTADGYDGAIILNSGTLAVNTSGPWRLDGSLLLNDTGTTYPEVTGSQMRVFGTLTVANKCNITAAIVIEPGSSVSIPDYNDALNLTGPTTFRGGSITGFGTLRQMAPATVTADTTIDVALYNWDGFAGMAGDCTVQSGVTFTINSDKIEESPTFDGYSAVLTLNSGIVEVNTDDPWRLLGTMDMNNTGGGTPTLRGAGVIISGNVATQGLAQILSNVYFDNPKVTLPSTGDILILDGSTTYNGGSYTGSGKLYQSGNAIIEDDTTIATGTFDWDGNAASEISVQPNVTFTIDSNAIDGSGGGYMGQTNVNTGGKLSVQCPWALNSSGVVILHAATLTGGAIDNGGEISGSGKIDVTGLTHRGTLIASSGPLTIQTNTGAVFRSTSTTTLNSDIKLVGSLIVEPGATVSGTGDLIVAAGSNLSGAAVLGVDLINYGQVEPGSSAGLLTVMGDYTQNSNAALEIELGGTTRGSQYDALIVSHTASFNGDLDVVLIGGFMPVSGNKFDILDWGARVGQFDPVSLPVLSAGLGWDASKLYTLGQIAVITVVSIDGDTDGDRDVDGDDYANLLAQFGGAPGEESADFNDDHIVNLADFVIMRRNFGNASAPTPESQSETPEPAALVMLALGGMALVRRRKNKANQRNRAAR
ncbi:MAG: PEP-CTERM sorting domain-containing protein [Phycisphaerales bacterium]|jgi:hypothetical protein|nr:PEP-CTERM sorting domain-containing protein [Phycisphaerales bacterium]